MERKKYFTQIPNETLEALARIKLCNYEIRYIFVLLRKTYGFHKTSDQITNSQFVKGTGIRKEHIARTEKRLLERKVVTKRGNRQMSFNPICEEWRPLPKKVTVAGIGDVVADVGNNMLPNEVNTKERKETKQKKDFCLILKNWNDSQTSPILNFKPENIINKHGLEKIENLIKGYGPQNKGFSSFLNSLKEQRQEIKHKR